MRANETLSKKVLKVVDQLAHGMTLASIHRDHALKGKLGAFRECHVESDWLLVYRIDDTVLILQLIATGSHSELFR